MNRIQGHTGARGEIVQCTMVVAIEGRILYHWGYNGVYEEINDDYEAVCHYSHGHGVMGKHCAALFVCVLMVKSPMRVLTRRCLWEVRW